MLMQMCGRDICRYGNMVKDKLEEFLKCFNRKIYFTMETEKDKQSPFFSIY